MRCTAPHRPQHKLRYTTTDIYTGCSINEKYIVYKKFLGHVRITSSKVHNVPSIWQNVKSYRIQQKIRNKNYYFLSTLPDILNRAKNSENKLNLRVLKQNLRFVNWAVLIEKKKWVSISEKKNLSNFEFWIFLRW